MPKPPPGTSGRGQKSERTLLNYLQSWLSCRRIFVLGPKLHVAKLPGATARAGGSELWA